jgi:hypothetical protein
MFFYEAKIRAYGKRFAIKFIMRIKGLQLLRAIAFLITALTVGPQIWASAPKDTNSQTQDLNQHQREDETSKLCEAALNAQGTNSTSQIREVFQRIFNRVYESSQSWSSGDCFVNAGELAREILAEANSDIDPNSLVIMVIKNKDISNPMLDESFVPLDNTIVGLNVRKGQDSVNGRRFALWKYHAVLEYRGTILDLDWSAPNAPIPAVVYFEKMFGAIRADFTKENSVLPQDKIRVTRDYNQWSTMDFVRVPVKDYLARFPNRPPSSDGLSFVWDYSQVGLLDYLK